jgi:hypothetical protein
MSKVEFKQTHTHKDKGSQLGQRQHSNTSIATAIMGRKKYI